MSFQGYLDTIKEKTGKTPDDFKRMAKEKGLTEYAELIAWLKTDYGLGLGHARAIVEVIRRAQEPRSSVDEAVENYFSGSKAAWRTTFDDLLEQVRQFGPDVRIAPTKTYLSLVRKHKKFAIVQVNSKRFEVGIKLKGAPVQGRFEESGTWNIMVTHRVRIEKPDQVDAELLTWLRQAYDKA